MIISKKPGITDKLKLPEILLEEISERKNEEHGKIEFANFKADLADSDYATSYRLAVWVYERTGVIF